MVEELASLVKDNLPCKHLILSIEESLVNFLRDDSSYDGVLELEPMNAYNRLLLHRLAEIFGPPVLVCDLLGEYGEFHPLTSSYQLLRSDKTVAVNDVKKVVRSSPIRKNADGNKIQTLYDSEMKSDIPIGQLSLKERKAAYMAARERIFTGSNSKMDRFSEHKPRGNPVVARRMISHALGRKLDPSNQTIGHKISGKNSIQSENGTNLGQRGKANEYNKKMGSTLDEAGVSRPRRSKESLKQEHTGAAKRMLANALGFPSGTNGLQKNSLK